MARVICVGCVICSEAFNAENAIVITKCGHQYHEACLKKWLAERPNVDHSSPDCRSKIDAKKDMKPVFAYYTSPDSSKMRQLEAENSQLHRQLFDANTNVAKIKRQLAVEKGLKTRLASKLAKLIPKKDDADDKHKEVVRELRSRTVFKHV